MVTLPDWLYKTTFIYHITAIDNLRSVLEAGQLYSTNDRPDNHTSIANADIQSRRATQVVEVEPGGVIHDYVPFYFAPIPHLLCLLLTWQ